MNFDGSGVDDVDAAAAAAAAGALRTPSHFDVGMLPFAILGGGGGEDDPANGIASGNDGDDGARNSRADAAGPGADHLRNHINLGNNMLPGPGFEPNTMGNLGAASSSNSGGPLSGGNIGGSIPLGALTHFPRTSTSNSPFNSPQTSIPLPPHTRRADIPLFDRYNPNNQQLRPSPQQFPQQNFYNLPPRPVQDGSSHPSAFAPRFDNPYASAPPPPEDDFGVADDDDGIDDEDSDDDDDAPHDLLIEMGPLLGPNGQPQRNDARSQKRSLFPAPTQFSQTTTGPSTATATPSPPGRRTLVGLSSGGSSGDGPAGGFGPSLGRMLGAVGSSNPNSAGINGTRSQPQRRVLFGRSPASIARTRRDGEDSGDTAGANVSGRGNSRSATAWRVWNETRNLDEFLSRVYEYFLDKGYTCCLLSRICNLCILAFIIWFSTFLAYCVDYRLIAKERTLVEVLRPQCVKNIHGLSALLLVTFSIWWVWQAFRLILDIPRLWEMKVFYEELLEIAEGAMDSLEWQEVVDKLVKLKSSTDGEAQSRRTERLDAFAIANRIMRKENYLIALFNKDILDLRLPYMGSKQMLTKIIEWNLSFCIIAYLFDDNGSVRKRFLKESNRLRLVTGLQKRFTMMALLNLLFAPFLLVLMILYFLFRSAEEYQKDPSSLGARQYTPYARWKFREFNELPHVFQRRLSRSYPNASKYLEQFPKRRIIILARFVSFIAGAFAAALAAITIIDQDILMGFEISPGRSALFYITVFGGILAASRSLTPDENQIFEPERIIREVAEDTHYLPETWRGKLHTEEVKAEFSALFDFKLLVFVQEIFSVLYAPIILYYSLPKCSEDIIDFCRDFTVQMDSIGYVCSFAVFNLRAHGNPKYGAPTEASNDHLMTKEGKMEQSFVYFKANNPKWEPGTDGSQFLQTLSRASRLPIFNAEASPSMENSVFRPRRQQQRPTLQDAAVRPISESALGVSEYEGDERAGRLFGLLDAVYQANQRGFNL